MAIYKGDQNQTVFFYESGLYANTSGAAQWIGQVQEVTIDEETNPIVNRFQGNGDRNVDQFLQGPRDFTGTVTYNPQDWKMLMFALGSNVDAGSPSPYTHTISEVNSASGNAFTSGVRCPFMSFGLEVGQKGKATGENFIRQIVGTNIDTFRLTGTQGEKLAVDVDFIAQNATFESGALATISPTTTRPFLWDDVSIQIPSGTAVLNNISFDWSIANNPDAKHFLNGSKVIASPTMDNRDYELSIVVEGNSEQTKTWYEQYFLGGSEFNVLMDITASTGSRDMFLTMSGCIISDMEAPHGLEGTNEQTITIMPKTCDVLVNDTIELYNPF